MPREVVSTPSLEKCKQALDSQSCGQGLREVLEEMSSKPFCVPRGCDLGKHMQPLMPTSRSSSNTSPSVLGEQGQGFIPEACPLSQALGLEGGRVFRSPRGCCPLPCTRWPPGSSPKVSFPSREPFRMSPTTVLPPPPNSHTCVFSGSNSTLNQNSLSQDYFWWH